jgi:hypothetical protein
MSPIDAALRGTHRHIRVRTNTPLRDALLDFSTIVKVLGTQPTHCSELVVHDPGYIGYCDASKLGAGGVWLAGTRALSPMVWRVEWPADIQQNVVSFDNPNGTITNSDSEMAGMLIHYLVLEHLVSLKHVHVAAWCDNTPAVSWTNKLSSSRAAIAGRLTCALVLRIHANEASPLISLCPSLASTIPWPICRHEPSIAPLRLPPRSKFQMRISYISLPTPFHYRTPRGASSAC